MTTRSAPDTVGEHVEIDLPLHPRHASTVRAVAASLAADADFTIDDIDDLRLGVNEAVSVLADVDPDSGGRLVVAFDVAERVVTVRARRRDHADPVDSELLDPLAERILRAVADEYTIGDDGVFVVVKRATDHG